MSAFYFDGDMVEIPYAIEVHPAGQTATKTWFSLTEFYEAPEEDGCTGCGKLVSFPS